MPLTTPIKFGDKAIDGSQMRPYVVMFGEYLSEMTKACELVRNADVFLVIGTSLTVFPANQLVRYAHKEIPRYIIDPGDLNIPEGYIRIKATATKGMELFFNEIQDGFKLFENKNNI